MGIQRVHGSSNIVLNVAFQYASEMVAFSIAYELYKSLGVISGNLKNGKILLTCMDFIRRFIRVNNKFVPLQ